MRLPSPLALLVLLALAGCTDKDDPNFGRVQDPWEVDDDEDGYTADVDCDDDDPSVTPDTAEICDGIDNDCDGIIDEDGTADALVWYEDDDGDGFGAGQGRVTCYPEDGLVNNDDDCDDSDGDRFPGNVETCDDHDEDCDDQVDENAVDPWEWYADADGDGYGDGSEVLLACDQPDGYLLYGTDCDDADAEIHPGAEEACDGIDNDCDDLADEVGETLYRDADGDGYGDPDEPIATCDEEEGTVADDTDCDDTDGLVNPGAEERSDGIDNDCDGETDEGTAAFDDDGDGWTEDDGDCDDADDGVNPGMDEACGDGVDQNCDGSANGCELSGDVSATAATATLTAEAASDHAGDWVALPGDVDGDGIGDLLVAAPEADGAGEDAGSLYLVYGAAAGTIPLADADAEVVGSAGDQLGEGSIGPGDLDGDGYADLLVGASGNDDGGTGAGAAWVFLGPLSGALEAGSADAGLLGDSDADALGYSMAPMGDPDGDGWLDVLVGMKGDATATTNAGAAILLPAPLGATVDADSAIARITGEARGDFAGTVVAGGSDTDGDGVADVAVGAPKNDAGGTTAGAAYALYGPISGTVSLADADARVLGAVAGDEAGTALAWVGDLDGDGLADLGVGAPYADTPDADAGAAAVLLGPPTGEIGFASADLYLPALAAKDRAGQALTGAGDLDGDGSDDLVITAFYEDSAARNAGVAYVLYGPLSAGASLDLAGARLLGEAEEDRLGGAVAGGADTDGDGAPDLLVGAHLSDLGATDGGAAILFRGGGL